MARTGDDSWDLASSVGATATMVAAARAMASAADDPLIDDPWAAPLVRAVGLDFFTKMLDGDLDLSQIPNSSSERMRAMIDAMASRTKFFDDHCIDSTAAGIRQVVILASGLDSRAYRLPWPTGTVVYELDQPQVIEFKSTTLEAAGARPTVQRRAIPIDLREDWPSALRAAGFDPAAPAAWLAGSSIRSPRCPRRAARWPPNLPRASSISTPTRRASCPLRCGSTASTSTWPSSSTPASAAT